MTARVPARPHGDWAGGPVAGRLDSALAIVLCAGAVIVPWALDRGHPDAFARPKTASLRIVLLVALAVAVVRIARRGISGIPLYPLLDASIGAFIATQLASYAFSVDRSQSFLGEPLQLQGLATVLAYVVAFYLARLAFGDLRRATWLLTAVAGGGLGVAVYAVAQRAGSDPIWDRLLDGRVFASLGQPNALGAYLVIVIGVGVGMLWLDSAVLRWLGGGAAAVSVPALAFTQSRGAFLGLAAAGLVVGLPVLWLARRRWRRWALALALAVLAGTLVAAVVAPLRREAADVWHRAASAVDLDSWDAVQRLALWEVGWSIAVDHPWVGTGQETYPLVFPEYRDRVLDEYRAGTFAPFRPESPHNAYLGIAAGSGFPALAAYLVVLGAWAVLVGRAAAAAGGRRRALLLGIAAAAAGHAVTSAFMTPEVTGTWLFWTLLGAGAALATLPGNSDFAL